jgi:hypothetical protein
LVIDGRFAASIFSSDTGYRPQLSVKDNHEALKEAKEFKAKVQASKNLVGDVDDLRRMVPSISDPFYWIRRLLDDLKKAGG